TEDVLRAIRTVVGPRSGTVSLHEPFISGNEWPYVKQCLNTGWVSSVGSFVDRFEVDLATFTGHRRAIATVNGTAALHICLLLAGVQPGDEVLLPTLTFIATANAISYCCATPHFCDSEELTLGLDPAKLDAYLREIVIRRGAVSINRRTGRQLRA